MKARNIMSCKMVTGLKTVEVVWMFNTKTSSEMILLGKFLKVNK